MKPIIKHFREGIATVAMCGKCGKVLTYKHYRNDRGVSCYNPDVIMENFCSNCGEPVEGYKEEIESGS